jgi:hypothetical protein
MHYLKKIKNSIANENGSPSVEFIVAICAMLIILVALCLLGATIIKWVGGATNAVYSLNL